MNPNDRRIFGWDYPPGAENDPRAPWNQVGDEDHCDRCGEELAEDWDEVTCKECQEKQAYLDSIDRAVNEDKEK